MPAISTASFRLLWLSGLPLLLATPLQAQSLFNTGSGSWHTPSLWGNGSVPTATQQARIGSATPVTATINAAATSNGGVIGNGAGETGTVEVGPGGSWTLSANTDLLVGGSGTGTLRILGGGVVSDRYGQIGYAGTGYATVSGTGSLWQNDTLEVGYYGNGTLTVADGGKVTGAFGSVGANSTATGTATITGAGSLWETSLSFGVGTFGTGTLRIEAGGKVTGSSATLGSAANSSGTATVTGAGSSWLNTSSVIAGNSGRATLNITDGGTVTASYFDIGYYASGNGTVLVSGGGSSLDGGYAITVGQNGTGRLDVTAGGKALSGSGVIGSAAGSTGTATISGSGSLWQMTSLLMAGGTGNGTLTIADGGRVTNADAYLGYGDGSSGTITATGAGTTWRTTGEFYLGYSGAGTLTIGDGAVVSAPSVTMALDGGASGTLNLNGTGTGRGVLETSFIEEATATAGGRINFDGGILRATGNTTTFLRNFEAGDILIHDGGAFIDTATHNITVSPSLRNASGKTGGLTKLGAGRLTLSGVSTYVGPTIVREGALWVTGTLQTTVTIQSGATLGGTGTVQAVTVGSGAFIAPGNSAGNLRTGSQIWDGGGTYLWEINRATGTAGTQWDLLSITGSLAINATAADRFNINLLSILSNGTAGNVNGFNAATDRSWQIASFTGAITGFDPAAFNINTTGFTNPLNGGNFTIRQATGGLFLDYRAVPEPGAILLSIITLAPILTLRRRG